MMCFSLVFNHPLMPGGWIFIVSECDFNESRSPDRCEDFFSAAGVFYTDLFTGFPVFHGLADGRDQNG
jgi:hypothetical protein